MIDFNNNANHVSFDIKALMLSRSKDTDRVRSKNIVLINQDIVFG